MTDLADAIHHAALPHARASGEPFEQVVRTRVLEPLGMRDAGFWTTQRFFDSPAPPPHLDVRRAAYDAVRVAR